MRAMRTILIICLVAGGLFSAAPATHGAPSNCADLVRADSYDISVEPRRLNYRIGDTAILDLEVTNRYSGAPVEGATAMVLLDWGARRAAIFGGGEKTDMNGHSTVRLKLKHKKLVPATMDAHVYSSKRHVSTIVCGDVIEYGFTTEEKVFRVRG